MFSEENPMAVVRAARMAGIEMDGGAWLGAGRTLSKVSFRGMGAKKGSAETEVPALLDDSNYSLNGQNIS